MIAGTGNALATGMAPTKTLNRLTKTISRNALFIAESKYYADRALARSAKRAARRAARRVGAALIAEF